ncbi:MAG TPA: DUF2752 domain-containing protein [Blastocatellia bacterium]|nr:DUF2752 domain-containing protein [Blastocatellia bacterium]
MESSSANNQTLLATEFSSRDRAQYIALSCVSGVVLAVARVLSPSPNGIGTHQQLGLPPCFFHKLTGIPCPTCGMTTSFAHTVRLQFYEAFIAQPFGLLACVLMALLIPLSFVLMQRRVPWLKVMTARGSNAVMYVLLVLLAAAWGYKIWAMR